MTQTKAELLETKHQGDIRLGDANSSHYVGLKAPATVSSNLVWTLPATDGSSNQFLKTDGSGNLSWATDSATDSTKMPLAGGTFTGDVIFSGAADNVVWDKSDNALEFEDNAKATIGTGADLVISHNGTRTIFDAATSKNIDFYYNGTQQFWFGNNEFKGKDNNKIILGDSDDLQLFHDGSNSYIKDVGTGNLYIYSENLRLENADGSKSYIEANNGGGVELFHNNTKKLETDADGVKTYGRFYAAGTFNYLESSSTSNSTITLKKSASGADVIDYLQCRNNANAAKLIIQSDGSIAAYDNAKIKLGDSADLQIYHGGASAWVYQSSASNDISLASNAGNVWVRTGASANKDAVKCVSDGAVELYHNNVKKLETTSGGANVVGALTVNGAALAGGGFASVQYFTSSGTWTKPSGIKIIRVTVIGGGGGGGRSNYFYDYGANGGGAGGFSQKIIDVTSISSETVTIGAGGSGVSYNSTGGGGGSTSFGSHCSASGGSGGSGQISGTSSSGSTTAGVGSNGNINLRGGYGSIGNRGQNYAVGGTGGASVMWGAGVPGGLGGSGGAIATYGSGGGGAAGAGTSTSGGAGLVVVEEFK